MLNVYLNDEMVKINPKTSSLLEVIQALGFEPDGPGSFAVALNGEFVPKATYHSKRVFSEDRLEIVAPLQGA